MPLRSATAETVAPDSSASVRTLTFCSAVQRRRRSTREMISPTLSIGVLTHVFKDANAHDLGQPNKGSRGLTLTPSLSHQTESFERLNSALGLAKGTPLSERIASGKPRSRKSRSKAVAARSSRVDSSASHRSRYREA